MAIKDIMRALVMPGIPGFGRFGIPLLFIGDPGEAKTSFGKQLAQSWCSACKVLSPGAQGEGGFGTVMVPVDGHLAAPPPAWTGGFNDGKDVAGLVVVDEVTSAPGGLQPALLQLVLEGQIGDYVFPRRTRIVGFCNPAERAANGTPLNYALANRFCHIPWPKTSIEDTESYDGACNPFGEMAEGAGDRAGDLAAEEARVMREWPEAWASACGLVNAFLRRRPAMKSAPPAEGSPEESGPWPSTRTWTMAKKVVAAARIHKLDQIDTELCVEGCVGKAAAAELFTFMAEVDMPDIAALLDGKETFAHNPARPDRTAAVLSGCATLVTQTDAKTQKARCAAFWKFEAALLGGGCDKDLLVPAAAQMLKARMVANEAATVLAAMRKTLAAAGITDGV